MAAKSSDSPWKRNPSASKGNFDAFKKKSNPKVEKKNDARKDKAMKAKAEVQVVKDMLGDAPVRLNRFIALAGVCSRREADELIKKGEIKVNGKVVKEMGQKVDPTKDKVVHKGSELKIKRFTYLLMNKPKDHISTVKDEKGRRTVMHLVKKYTKTRVYPVGRLDRNTTGLLLFTNDGDLTKRLTHPSYEVPKIYNVRLDKEVDPAHIEELRQGIKLEDGFIKADKIDFLEADLLNEVGVEIHSGRNRIVRRMFEHFGYSVVALDRVRFGPLTKKNLPRGNCRILDDKEIGFLKMLK